VNQSKKGKQPRSTAAATQGKKSTASAGRTIYLAAAILVAGGLIAASVVYTRRSHAQGPTSSAVAAKPDPRDTNRTYTGKPGAWGQLEYTRIAIEPPEEFLVIPPAGAFTPAPWVFTGWTTDQVRQLLHDAELTHEQRDFLTTKAEWREENGSVKVSPSREVLLGLSKAARQKIYPVLARFPENLPQVQPFSFRPEFLEERLEQSGLKQQTIEAFKNPLYPVGSLLFLADATAFASTISDDQERARFVRTISRRGTLLVRLAISPDSNVDQLDRYWNASGMHKELRPLFESLTRVPGGARIDVAHLLPPFPRKRIFTFPARAEDQKHRDCHWTTMNFNNDTADDQFCNAQTVKQVLDQDYVKAEGDPHLGDVVILFHPGGQALHSGVFIADDIVFTKNGGASSQPFIYQTISDMYEYYAACSPPDNPPQMVFLRKR